MKSLLFADKSSVEIYVRVMRHRNETYGWHVCAGRVKHVVDLEPDGRPHRTSRLRGAPEVGEHAPEGIATKR